MNKYIAIATLGLLAGCGVSNGTRLADLEESDWQKLCEETEPESFTCEGDGFSTTYEFGDCETSDTDGGGTLSFPDTCEATVGDWRDCEEAWREVLRADPCDQALPPECDFFTDETCAATVE